METNPLLAIRKFGQSIWLDDISRRAIRKGELQHLIEADGLRGVTSNPSIFRKAIGDSTDYDQDIRSLAIEGKSAVRIYQTLTIGDVQEAADLFRPIYDASKGAHGFVSLEVNPHLARKVQATLDEARQLWHGLNRPNVMIKVPATREGLACIEQLTSEGINVNVTLLFTLSRYREVAHAYIAGLQARAQRGERLEHVASVASFFLSRIDAKIDPLLQACGAAEAAELKGRVAVASAKQAYLIYKEIFGSNVFRSLARRRARPQRLLWASTSAKDPEFSDVKYVEALVGPDTVNTLPRKTLDAYRDHGRPAPLLEYDAETARSALNTLSRIGLDMDRIGRQLVEEGIEKFNKPFDDLLRAIEDKRAQAAGRGFSRATA